MGGGCGRPRRCGRVEMAVSAVADQQPFDANALAWKETVERKNRVRVDFRFPPSASSFVAALSALLFLSGCTAGSKSAVLARFPTGIGVGEFDFFETDSRSCTFAEVSISEGLEIDPSRMKMSRQALYDIDPATPFSVLEFPEDGFHYFNGLSVAELATVLRKQGDEDLAYQVEETIFDAKRCWRRGWKVNSKEMGHFAELVLKREGIIVLGADIPNTLILLYPDKARAIYFGP